MLFPAKIYSAMILLITIWSRRGPSCHLGYTLPTNEDINYFYNEVTIPKGEDKIGSYFMANGFGEGYFGMQVNSETKEESFSLYGVLLKQTIQKKYQTIIK